MISLRDLQRDFLRCALGDTQCAERPWIVANGLSISRRLQIYRNNAEVGFEKAMQATFPSLVRLGGTDWFNQTARAYHRVHPSRSGDLNDVGGEFAVFLSRELKGSDFAYFADVAELEWIYQECLDECATLPGSLEGLTLHLQEDLSQLRFQVAPSMRLIESIYPLFEIWNQNRCDREPSAIIDLFQGPSRLLVIRRVDHVEVREVTGAVFSLLSSFAVGLTVLEAAAVIDGHGDADFSEVLAQLFGLGVLVGFQLSSIGE